MTKSEELRSDRDHILMNVRGQQSRQASNERTGEQSGNCEAARRPIESRQASNNLWPGTFELTFGSTANSESTWSIRPVGPHRSHHTTFQVRQRSQNCDTFAAASWCRKDWIEELGLVDGGGGRHPVVFPLLFAVSNHFVVAGNPHFNHYPDEWRSMMGLLL